MLMLLGFEASLLAAWKAVRRGGQHSPCVPPLGPCGMADTHVVRIGVGFRSSLFKSAGADHVEGGGRLAIHALPVSLPLWLQVFAITLSQASCIRFNPHDSMGSALACAGYKKTANHGRSASRARVDGETKAYSPRLARPFGSAFMQTSSLAKVRSEANCPSITGECIGTARNTEIRGTLMSFPCRDAPEFIAVGKPHSLDLATWLRRISGSSF